MHKQNTRRGFTQIKRVGQALPDNAPAKGHLGAFTLIELLIAVLIIGVLAAVAVPQYKHAVLKSRVSSVIPLAQSLAKAQEVRWLHNGEYADALNQLDVSPAEGTTNVTLSPKDRFKYVLAYHQDVPNVHYIVYQNHSPEFANNVHCEAKTDDAQALWVCEKGLGGKKLDSGRITKGFTTYILQGSETDGVFSYTYYNNDAPQYVTDGDSCVATQANGPCSSRSYDNESKCYANAQNTCSGRSHFDHGSTCQTDKYHYYGCNNNTFDNQSVCIGNHIETCIDTSFFHGSVCYANTGSTCRGAHYDSTSYCAGSYCPAGAPAGDKDGIFAGKCWDGNGNYGPEHCP